MTEKTKRKNDVRHSRRPLAIGLIALIILAGMTGLMLTSLSAQADAIGHLYYGYTIDPTVEAYYRADLAGGPGGYAPYPLPKETTVGYEAPPPPRAITRRVVWQARLTGRADDLIIRDVATGTDLQAVGPFYSNYQPLPDTAYSADGKQAVFSAYTKPWTSGDIEPREQDLWLVNLETGNLRQLTKGTADDRNPTFIMDGRSILYLSDSDGTSRLYKMDVESKRSEILTPSLGNIIDYAWSPDNTQIVLLALLRQNAESQEILEQSSKSLILMTPTTWTQRDMLSDRIYDVVWSPDSQWLAYTTYDPMETLEERSYGGVMGVSSTPYYEERPSSLWIIRTDGTGKQLISGSRLPLHSLDWIP